MRLVSYDISALLNYVMMLLLARIAKSLIPLSKINGIRTSARNIHTHVLRLADSNKAIPDPWYSGGLSFSCTMCGNCCSGSSGSVRFSKEEAAAKADELQIDVDKFYELYTRRRGRGSKSYQELKEVKSPVNGEDRDCIFLDRKKIPGKAICSLYQSRPLQCKTWPFWSEILESKSTWEDAKRGYDGCPGLGRGQLFPVEEIERQRIDTDIWCRETFDKKKA
jgi:Fe-S-cluster containining protein